MSIVSVLALQACQVLDVFDGDAPAEAEPSIEVTQLPVDPAYPKLRTVPPRPQLSYSVEQQREIVESLIGDREHARYTSQRIRYRAGLSSLPPPPPPDLDDATSTANAIVGDGQQTPASPPAPRADVPSAGYDISDPQIDDDAGLGDFMRNMVEETEPTSPAEVETSPSDDAPQPEPEDSSGVIPSTEMSAAPSSHSSAAPASGDPSATRLFAWIDGPGATAAVAGTTPSPESGGASSKASPASAAAGAVPVRAAAAPRRNGAEVEVARAVEVTAVSEPATVTPGSDGNAQASRDDADEPSPATPAAAPLTKPEVQPAWVSKPEPDTANGPRSGSAALATVTFADGSAELSAEARSTLEDALAALESDGVIEIVGRGELMTLALDRARAVAVGLMRLGAGAGALKISAEAAPAANEVRIRVGGRRS